MAHLKQNTLNCTIVYKSVCFKLINFTMLKNVQTGKM